jgi:hypothetical protein
MVVRDHLPPDALRRTRILATDISHRILATARTGPDARDVLVTFDPRGGTSRLLGDTGFSCIYALAAFGQSLYGMTCLGDVLALDPATGAGRRIAASATVFYGATAR